MHPPRTTAVVLTLQPSAVEKGTTYADILTQAKDKISMDEIGIPGIKIRKAATGARILQIPGAASGDKADILAQKLKDALPADCVRVDRPVKCADLRVSGLDDSATVAEVVAAVCRIGGCCAEAIKTGEIRYTSSGQGHLFVRCPVAAANKVAASKLLVGWVSAQVKVLPPRPRQCYRCHEVGHTAVQCTSGIDRSGECFRCGQNGHKSAVCSASPHCSICMAAGRSADHRCGAKSCKGVTAKNKKQRAAVNGQNTQTCTAMVVAPTLPTSRVVQEEAMEIK